METIAPNWTESINKGAREKVFSSDVCNNIRRDIQVGIGDTTHTINYLSFENQL